MMKIRLAMALSLAVCAPAALAETATDAAPPMLAASASTDAVEYVAHLHPLNTKVTGTKAGGEARFVVKGDTLAISIDAHGLPPGMMHLQHFHGFADHHQARCPTVAADVNGDGIIDLIETEPVAGTTMVPFHADPVSMQIVNDTYPKAAAAGSFSYRKTVSLSGLGNAFGKAFGHESLALDRRVVFIHGVAAGAKLPASVASLGDIPARVTLPIACGEIEQIKR